jgi:hypothetical protein
MDIACGAASSSALIAYISSIQDSPAASLLTAVIAARHPSNPRGSAALALEGLAQYARRAS